MNTIFKNHKNWRRTTLDLLLILALLLIVSCEADDSSEFGIDSEPYAAIAFLQDSITVKEGDTLININVGVSKKLFSGVSFKVVADSANLDGDSFLVPENLYSIDVEEKKTSISFVPQDDDEFNGNAEGFRKVKVLLKNLQGEGAFLAESNIGSDKNNNQMYTELAIYVIEDEQVPPFIDFEGHQSSIKENSVEPAIITINFSKATETSGTFNVNVESSAIVDTHYTSTPLTINEVIQVPYSEGTTKVEIEFVSIDNEEIDPNRILNLSLADIGRNLFEGEITQHQFEIIDDDLPTKKTEILAEADAWIRGQNGSGHSDENGGSKSTLLVSNSDRNDGNVRESYMKFDLTNVDPTKIIEAKVVLTTIREADWANAEENYGGITTQSLFYVSDDIWGELTITANTKPASGTTPIATYTSDFLIGQTTLQNLEHEFDITGQLKSETDDKLSIRLTTSNTLGQRIFYSSRERNDDLAPKLVIIESLQ